MRTQLVEPTPTDAPQASPAPAGAQAAVAYVIPTTTPPKPTPGIPMFPDIGKDPRTVVAGLRVWRKVPEEVYLGVVEPNATEEDLKARFGGRVLFVEAYSAEGLKIRGGSRTIQIDAPPKHNGLPDTTTPAAQPAFQDMLAAHQQAWKIQQDALRSRLDEERAMRDEERKRLADERRAELEARRAEFELRIKEEDARAARELAAERERADRYRKEQEEKHARELAIERERIEARIREAEERRRSDTESSKQMLQFMLSAQDKSTQVLVAAMGQNKAQDPMVFATLLKDGMQLAAGMGQPDPAVAITQSVATGIEGMAKLASAHQIENAQIRAKAGAAKQLASRNPAAAKAGAAKAEKSPAAESLAKVMGMIREEGADPEEVLAALASGELKLIPKTTLRELAAKAGVPIEDDEEDPSAEEEEEDEQAEGVDRAKPAQDTRKRERTASHTPTPATAEGEARPSPRRGRPNARATSTAPVAPHRGTNGAPGNPSAPGPARSGLRDPAPRSGRARARSAAPRTDENHVSAGAPGDLPSADENAKVANR